MSSERRVFHVLLKPEEALRRVFEHVEPGVWGVERVELVRAYGRVLAENVYAKNNHPPFTRSTVDGYAVRSLDLSYASEVAPRKLRVKGSVRVGEWPELEVGPGEAVEVDTGAPIPRGADAVVMVEHTKRVGDEVIVYRGVIPGENTAKIGSDVSIGDLVLRRCTMLGEREIAVLAATGYDSVLVFRKPRVAVISTGVELVKPGSGLPPGKVYDVNTYSIIAGLMEAGAEPFSLGVVGDDPEELALLLGRAEREADIIVVSGGTSAGPTDYAYRAIESLDSVRVVAHGILVKPGKPTMIAVTGSGKLIFGLPGHPGAALTMLNLIVKPVIKRGLCIQEEPAIVRARLARRVEGAKGRRALVPVSLVEREGGEIVAYPIPAESGAVRALSLAEGYIVVDENTEYVDEGEEVSVNLYSPSYKPAGLYIIGSHDVALDSIIIPKLGVRVKTLYVGSEGGVEACVRGDADIAGIHLLDPESGDYNIPLLEKRGVKGAVLVRGFQREQGIVVQKGNPYSVKSFEDILAKRLRIVNRNKGSGTRALVDYMLRKIAEKQGASFSEIVRSLEGYTREVSTHTAVAAIIAQGLADAGVATRLAAELYGLEFVSLGWEQFDFLIPKSRLRRPGVERFLEALEELKREIARLPGYRIPEDYARVVWES